MARVRIHQLASELGMPNTELIRVSQALGYPIQSHANTVSLEEAEELRSALFALAGAGRAHKEAVASPDRPEQDSLMLVHMSQHDVRISVDYEEGFTNMLKLAAALLSDLKQTVRTESETVSWGNLYFLRSDTSTPTIGHIELEYGENIYGSQRQKGILGDIIWSIRWLTDDITRPFQKLSMLIGLTRDPEGDYRNQLVSDMRSLEARNRILGLDEWDIETAVIGRNIYITPRKECIAKK
jgi:hypothetical protein